MPVTRLPVVSRTFVGSPGALAVGEGPCSGLELLGGIVLVAAPRSPGPSRPPNTPPKSRRETGLAAMGVMRKNNSKSAGGPPLSFIE